MASPHPESLSSNHYLSVTDSYEWYLDFLGGQVGLSSNVILIYSPITGRKHGPTRKSAPETNLKFNLSLSESDRLRFELKIYL